MRRTLKGSIKVPVWTSLWMNGRYAAQSSLGFGPPRVADPR